MGSRTKFRKSDSNLVLAFGEVLCSGEVFARSRGGSTEFTFGRCEFVAIVPAACAEQAARFRSLASKSRFLTGLSCECLARGGATVPISTVLGLGDGLPFQFLAKDSQYPPVGPTCLA